MKLLRDRSIAIITPPRCGTRYISGCLQSLGLLQPGMVSHHFDRELYNECINDGVKVVMFIRDPFIRERSVYRWLTTIGKVHPNTTFEQYIQETQADEVPSYFEHLENDMSVIENIDYVDINDIEQWFMDELQASVEPHNHSYFQPADDLDDVDVYRNRPDLINPIRAKYAQDIEFFNFNITNDIIRSGETNE